MRKTGEPLVTQQLLNEPSVATLLATGSQRSSRHTSHRTAPKPPPPSGSLWKACLELMNPDSLFCFFVGEGGSTHGLRPPWEHRASPQWTLHGSGSSCSRAARDSKASMRLRGPCGPGQRPYSRPRNHMKAPGPNSLRYMKNKQSVGVTTELLCEGK